MTVVLMYSDPGIATKRKYEFQVPVKSGYPIPGIPSWYLELLFPLSFRSRIWSWTVSWWLFALCPPSDCEHHFNYLPDISPCSGLLFPQVVRPTVVVVTTAIAITASTAADPTMEPALVSSCGLLQACYTVVFSPIIQQHNRKQEPAAHIYAHQKQQQNQQNNTRQGNRYSRRADQYTTRPHMYTRTKQVAVDISTSLPFGS